LEKSITNFRFGFIEEKYTPIIKLYIEYEVDGENYSQEILLNRLKPEDTEDTLISLFYSLRANKFISNNSFDFFIDNIIDDLVKFLLEKQSENIDRLFIIMSNHLNKKEEI